MPAPNDVLINANGWNVSVEWDAVGGADLFRSQGLSESHNEFAEDEAKIVPGLGEMGEPVVLQGREGDLGETIMKTEAFNLVVSDKISYTREVPDTRDNRCKVCASINIWELHYLWRDFLIVCQLALRNDFIFIDKI